MARPPGHAALFERLSEEQVPRQVPWTHRAIEAGLGAVRWLELDYEPLCAEPACSWAAPRKRLAALGADPGAAYPGPARLQPRRAADAREERALRRAL